MLVIKGDKNPSAPFTMIFEGKEVFKPRIRSGGKAAP